MIEEVYLELERRFAAGALSLSASSGRYSESDNGAAVEEAEQIHLQRLIRVPQE